MAQTKRLSNEDVQKSVNQRLMDAALEKYAPHGYLTRDLLGTLLMMCLPETMESEIEPEWLDIMNKWHERYKAVLGHCKKEYRQKILADKANSKKPRKTN